MSDFATKALAVAVAALALIVPASGLLGGLGLDAAQGVALGVLLSALILWITEAVPLFVTGAMVALLGATLLAPVLGKPSDTFVTPFASDVSLLFLGGFVLSEVMRKAGLDRRLAQRVLGATGDDSRHVVGGVLLTTAGLSMWMSNTAAATMMLALLGALLVQIPAGDPLRRALVLAVAAGANLGGMGTPIGTPPNAVALASLGRTDTPPPGFLLWMLLALPVVAVTLYGAWRLILSWHPPTLAHLRFESAPEPLTDSGKAAAALVALTAGLWLTGGLHPLTPGTVGLVPLILAFGSGLLPAKALRTLPWEVLGVVGGGLCLGVVVSESGLDDWLMARLPTGGLSSVGIIVAMSLVGASLSAVMSNTAAANLVLPLALAIPGVDGLPLALAIAFSCSAAMPLPVSTPPNTLVFGSGEIDAPTFTRAGLALSGIGVAATLVVGLPWWAFVGWLRS